MVSRMLQGGHLKLCRKIMLPVMSGAGTRYQPGHVLNIDMKADYQPRPVSSFRPSSGEKFGEAEALPSHARLLHFSLTGANLNCVSSASPDPRDADSRFETAACVRV